MNQPILVADIGGTNARFALYDQTSHVLSAIEKITITKRDNLLSLAKNYIAKQSVTIEYACIAIACPVEGDWVAMTNNHLAFSQSQLQQDLKLKHLTVINDFTAVAMSIPALKNNDVEQIGGEKPKSGYPIAVYGAGTGLGVAYLLNINDHWVSLAGEGGHTELPMINEQEDQILLMLRKKFKRVSAERFLSGNGIVNIYQALLQIHQQPIEDITPDIIVNNALSNSCSMSQQALTLFCTFMGRLGGNLALTLNTQGGVYIAGGIVPRFIDFLKASPFRDNFENKGRMTYLLKKIPVYVITHDYPGLLGAGMYMQNNINKQP